MNDGHFSGGSLLEVRNDELAASLAVSILLLRLPAPDSSTMSLGLHTCFCFINHVFGHSYMFLIPPPCVWPLINVSGSSMSLALGSSWVCVDGSLSAVYSLSSSL